MSINWLHRHEWIEYDFNAVGKFEKQEGQADSAFYCRGLLKVCACKMAMLFPWNKGLRPVEVLL